MKTTILEVNVDPVNTVSLVFNDGFCVTKLRKFKYYFGKSLRHVRLDLDKQELKFREISFPEKREKTDD